MNLSWGSKEKICIDLLDLQHVSNALRLNSGRLRGSILMVRQAMLEWRLRLSSGTDTIHM